MTMLEEDFRRLAEALGEQVVVPPFNRVTARRRRRRPPLRFAVPALAAAGVAAVALGAVVTHTLQNGPTTTSAGTTAGPAAAGPTAGHSFALAEPAPPCHSADLRASFTPSSGGTGRELGRIVVVGASTPCSPGDAVTLTADAGDRSVGAGASLSGDAVSAANRLTITLALPDGTATTCATRDPVGTTALTLTFASGARVRVDGDVAALATCGGGLAVDATPSTS